MAKASALKIQFARWSLVRVAAHSREWGCSDLDDQLADVWFREALEVASPRLLDRLASDPTNEGVRAAVSRYANRSANRATPFGLFAAVGIGSVGETTSLRLPDASGFHRRVMVAVDSLNRLITATTYSRELRSKLRYRVNPTWHTRGNGGRIFQRKYNEHAPDAAATNTDDQADTIYDFDLSAPLIRLTEFIGKNAAHFDDLMSMLVAEIECTANEASEYLHQLIDQQILVPNAVPCTLSAAPSEHVLGELTRFSSTLAINESLVRALASVGDVDGTTMDEPLAATRDAFRSACSALPAEAKGSPVWIDLEVDAKGMTLGRDILAQARTAATFLIEHKARAPHLDRGGAPSAFFRRFTERFEDRFCPLPEALALAVEVESEGPHVSDPAPVHVDAALMRLFSRALRSDEDIVLTANDLVEKQYDVVPASSNALSFRLAKGASLGRPDLPLVVVTPSLAGASVSRTAGRFSRFSGEIREALRHHAVDEQHRSKATLADVCIRPRGVLATLESHAPFRDAFVEFDPAPDETPGARIALSDLELGVRAGAFVLRRRADRQEIEIQPSSAVNPRWMPDFARQLWRLGQRKDRGPFDWGPLEIAPYRPRVWLGNILLAAASWNVSADDLGHDVTSWDSKFAAHLREHKIPRHVCLVDLDNILAVDLDLPSGRSAVLSLLKKAAASSPLASVRLEEAIDSAVARSPRGWHTTEFVLPFFGKEPITTQKHATTTVASPNPREDEVRNVQLAFERTTLPPGSEVVYVKVYGDSRAQQTALFELSRLAKNLARRKTIAKWTYLRFAEPEPHLRFRLFATSTTRASRANTEVLAILESLAQRQIIWKSQADTYVREVETYGGHYGMQLTESWYGIDSRAAEEMTRSVPPVSTLRPILFGVGALEHARAFGFSTATAIRIFREIHRSYERELGAEVRESASREFSKNRERWREAVLGISSEKTLRRGIRLYAKARADFAELSRDLMRGIDAGHIESTVIELFSRYVHLHGVRVFTNSFRTREAVAIGVLASTLDWLSHTGDLDEGLGATRSMQNR